MTGYTVHTGSNEKFTEGWDRIFTEHKKTGSQPTKKSDKQKAAGKSRQKKSAR